MMVKTGGAFKNAKLISILMGSFMFGFLTLLDYEPVFSSSPQDGNSPLLGKLGSILPESSLVYLVCQLG